MGLGFVAGFSQNNTFRPQLAVTREQLVSLVLESFQGIQGANITFLSNLSIRLYSEVDISRWSAGKFLFAWENKIVRGDKNGTFKPTQPVTGVELIGVLPIAAEFRWSVGMQPNLVAKEPSKTFQTFRIIRLLLFLLKCLLIVLLLPLLTKWAIGLLSIILQSGITRRLLCGC
ncbi:S-layer homology domain-containing protein [Microcoleus sp.]|uniref:S-layer homology domain-containing protein n=1 Tax=Microcoleus sp. TaxID=44472 RepID=UPI00403E61F4